MFDDNRTGKKESPIGLLRFAGYNGGVICATFSSVHISINESSFTRNKATEEGGVMYIEMAGSQVRITGSSFEQNNAYGKGNIIAIHGSQLDMEDVHVNTTSLCGVIRSCISNVTIDSQDNFTKRADPNNSSCILYDIESSYNCNVNDYDPWIIPDSEQNSHTIIYPWWPEIAQSVTTSQTTLAVSLPLCVFFLILITVVVIICIILYRQGKLKFKKWPGLFVNNPCLYVSMNNNNETSTVAYQSEL